MRRNRFVPLTAFLDGTFKYLHQNCTFLSFMIPFVALIELEKYSYRMKLIFITPLITKSSWHWKRGISKCEKKNFQALNNAVWKCHSRLSSLFICCKSAVARFWIPHISKLPNYLTIRNNIKIAWIENSKRHCRFANTKTVLFVH